ncbi:MAG: hypothetical protein AD073_000285 [Mycoplasmataceae bacterium]|nr:MAG: hypothetical protein AD073_000285 [Mycoplasmataceae bacterium]
MNNENKLWKLLSDFWFYLSDQMAVINEADLSKVPLWTFFVFLFSLCWLKMIINLLKVIVKFIIYATIGVIIIRVIIGLSSTNDQTYEFKISDLQKTISGFFKNLGLSF